MSHVATVTPLESATLIPTSYSAEYYMDRGIGAQRYCFSRGDLSKKQLVWDRDDRGDTYFRCSCCFKILKMNIAYNLIIGRHLYSVNCEHCYQGAIGSGCGKHTWLVLKNWVGRRLRGSIKFRPNTCPACGSKNTHSEIYPFRYCRDCQVRWKLAT